MKRIRKIFFETEMTWKRVTILSILCGVIPGLLMIPEFLDDTSLQQPGISFEFWIFMAMLVILNCKKPLEAGLKTFVFFLISQPLIYLVQVPFCIWHWGIFRYYPEWGVITLFTLPGGMIAWYTKKENWLSIAILSVANLILSVELPTCLSFLLENFPKFLLSTLFIIMELLLFPMLLFEDKKKRTASYAVSAVMVVLSTVLLWGSLTRHIVMNSVFLEGGQPYEIISEYDDLEITIEDDLLTVTSNDYGSWDIIVRDGEGKETTYRYVSEKDGSSFEAVTSESDSNSESKSTTESDSNSESEDTAASTESVVPYKPTVMRSTTIYVNNTENGSKDSSGSKSSGSKSSGYYSSGSDSYDDGYDDAYEDDDYDEDRYENDSDYAAGVDDAMDDCGW